MEERLAHVGVGTPTLEDIGGLSLTDFAGDSLPDEAQPLRTPLTTLSGGSEFYVFGVGVGGGAVVDLDRPGLGPAVGAHVVAQPAGGLEVFVEPASLALQADADGREEMFVFDLRPATVGGPQTLFAFRLEDEEDAYRRTTAIEGDVLGTWPGADMLHATRRDVDADGLEEVFLLARVGADWQHRMYSPATGVLGPAVRGGALADATVPGTFSDFSLSAGQIDDDPEEEVLLLINNTIPGTTQGDTRLVILDHTGSGDVVIRDFRLRMRDGESIVAAGVVAADIDGDFRDEIVVAGTDTVDASGSYTQRLTVLNDLGAAALPYFARIYQNTFTHAAGTGSSTVRIRDTQLSVARTTVSTVPLNVPGAAAPAGASPFDPAEDVLVNNVLWEWSPVDLSTLPAPVSPQDRASMMARGPREIFPFASDTELIVSRDTVQFALGQLNSDLLPDAAVLTRGPSLFAGNSAGMLRIRSVLGSTPDTSTVLTPDGSLPMQLVPANVDMDSLVVRYLGHAMRYSEPVILAALAAPPCYPGPVGQFTDECKTTFGNSSTSATSSSTTYGFSLGVTVGFDFEDRVFTQSELRATFTARVSAAYSAGSSSELTFSQSYTNGAPEDEVLATVFGLEQFTYLIVSAPPGASGEVRAGQRMMISLPRTQTTRLFSESLIRPALRPSQAAAIDAVFDHTPTVPLSYHRRSELRDYMNGLGITGPECNQSTSPAALNDCGYLTRTTAVDTGVVSLPGGVSGAGTSADGSFVVATDTSASTSWGIEASIDLEMTAGGVVFGVEVGASRESTLTVSHGSSVQYAFAVGAVDPAVYDPYKAQLVAYRYRYDCRMARCQTFDVLNYWTESTAP